MSSAKRSTSRSVLDQLEVTQRQGRDLNTLPQMMKPCVAAMLEEGVLPGYEPDPNTACFMVASEMKRLGKTQDEAGKACHEWQAEHGDVLGFGEVERTVRSAYGGECQYGCGTESRLYNSDYCMGHDKCPYYKQLGASRKPRDQDYFDYGWPERLNPAARNVYVAICELDRRAQRPGAKHCVTYRRLHKLSGVSTGHMKKPLQ